MANKTTTWKGPGANYWLTTPSNPSGILTSPEADTQAEFDEWVASMDASYGSGGWGFSVAPSADPPPPAGAPPGMWTSDDDNGTYWQASGTTGPWKASDPFIGPGTNWGTPVTGKDTYIDPALDPITGQPPKKTLSEEELRVQDQLDWEEAQSLTEAKRGTVYSRYLDSQLAGRGRPEPTIKALERQSNAFSDIYNLGRGLGDVQPTTSFSDFMRSRGIDQRLNPSEFQGLFERARTLIGQTPQTGESENLASFRDDLSNDLDRQYDLAYRSRLPGVARELHPTLGDLSNNTFNQYQLRKGLGEITDNFLDYENQYGLSGQGNTYDFQGGVRSAADLISGSETGLSGERAAFRQQLLDDPDDQYELALQAALPKVRGSVARKAFTKAALRSFRRFQEEKGMYTPYLPEFTSKNFSFF